jgi:hypothetical protein
MPDMSALMRPEATANVTKAGRDMKTVPVRVQELFRWLRDSGRE